MKGSSGRGVAGNNMVIDGHLTFCGSEVDMKWI
jgi:hypothetical protein